MVPDAPHDAPLLVCKKNFSAESFGHRFDQPLNFTHVGKPVDKRRSSHFSLQHLRKEETVNVHLVFVGSG